MMRWRYFQTKDGGVHFATHRARLNGGYYWPVYVAEDKESLATPVGRRIDGEFEYLFEARAHILERIKRLEAEL